MKKTLHCNECGRKVKDNPESKTRHVLRFHAHLPLIRVATTMFSPVRMEELGARFGEFVKRMVS